MTQPNDPPDIDQAVLDRFFSTATHDQLSKIPAYDHAVNQAISKGREEVAQQIQQTQAQQAAYLEWNKYFDDLEAEDKTKPGILQSALRDPNVRKHYDIVQNIRSQVHDPELLRQQAAVEFTTTIVNELKQHPDYKDLDIADILTEAVHPGQKVAKIIARGLESGKKQLAEERTKMQADIDASINNALAKRGFKEPSTPASPRDGSNGSRYSKDQLLRMARTDPIGYRKLVAEDPDGVNTALSEEPA